MRVCILRTQVWCCLPRPPRYAAPAASILPPLGFVPELETYRSLLSRHPPTAFLALTPPLLGVHSV